MNSLHDTSQKGVLDNQSNLHRKMAIPVIQVIVLFERINPFGALYQNTQ